MERFDLLVIGGGVAGMKAALRVGGWAAATVAGLVARLVAGLVVGLVRAR